jgi:disulfide bond formation protein DsbB
MVGTMPSPLRLPLFVLAVSVLALAFAFTAEFGFGLKPCILCLAQRVPFALAGALAGLALLRSMPFAARRVLMAVTGLAFLINSGIAVYHVGVEQKWWASSCAASESGPLVVGDLAAMMSKPVEARCDEPAWQWHGITMATLNIPFSAGLAILVLAVVARRRSWS